MSAFMREFNMLAEMLHEEHDAAVTAVESEANACLELALELLDLVAIKSLDAEKELSQLLEDYDDVSKELTTVRSMMVSARKCKPKQDDDCDDDDEYEDEDDGDDDDDLEEEDYDDVEMLKIRQHVSKVWLNMPDDSVLTYEGLKSTVTKAGKIVVDMVVKIYKAFMALFASKETYFKSTVAGLKAAYASEALKKSTNLAIKEGTDISKIAPLMESSVDSNVYIATGAMEGLIDITETLTAAHIDDSTALLEGRESNEVLDKINQLAKKKFGKDRAVFTSAGWGLTVNGATFALSTTPLKAEKTFMIPTDRLMYVIREMISSSEEAFKLFKEVAASEKVIKLIRDNSQSPTAGKVVDTTKTLIANMRVFIDTHLFLMKAPLHAIKMANISEDKE